MTCNVMQMLLVRFKQQTAISSRVHLDPLEKAPVNWPMKRKRAERKIGVTQIWCLFTMAPIGQDCKRRVIPWLVFLDLKEVARPLLLNVEGLRSTRVSLSLFLGWKTATHTYIHT